MMYQIFASIGVIVALIAFDHTGIGVMSTAIANPNDTTVADATRG